MRLQVKLAFVMVAISGFASHSLAAKGGTIECESSEDSVLCVALPSEAPEEFPSMKATTTAPRETISLITANETSGAAFAPAELETDLNSSVLPTAQVAAMKAQENLRSVELFLKSGIGSKGDLRVVTTGLQQ